MRKTFGDRCIPLILNGCCGNINPWDPFDPDYAPDYRRMGNALAETTLKIIETLSYEEDNALGWGIRRIKLPIRDVKPELLAQAKRILDECPQPGWSEQNPRRIDGEWMKNHIRNRLQQPLHYFLIRAKTYINEYQPWY